MLNLLATVWTHPLEREYEGWVTREIEDYFVSVGRTLTVFAVRPTLEAEWPADEALFVNSKVVGLQLKRPYLQKDAPDPAALYWRLGQRAGTPPKKDKRSKKKKQQSQEGTVPSQFEMILASTTVVYCLPAFINRKYRRGSLSHCLFWHPSDIETEGWDHRPTNGEVKVEYDSIKHAQRWGYFVEALARCDRGKLVKTEADLNAVFEELTSISSAAVSGPSPAITTPPTSPAVTVGRADDYGALLALTVPLSDEEVAQAEERAGRHS